MSVTFEMNPIGFFGTSANASDWLNSLSSSGFEALQRLQQATLFLPFVKFVGEQMTEYGTAPVLIESIKAEIEIETDISTYEVWGISPEGFYIGMVPTKYEDGKLTISLGTESRSMYYLIVKNLLKWHGRAWKPAHAAPQLFKETHYDYI